LSNKAEGCDSPDLDEDGDLVVRSQRGEIDAFESLVIKHQKKMLNLAYRMTGNYDDACDIVQDAFVAAYKGIGGFQRKSRFSTWLSTITMNLARNRLRQVATEQQRHGLSLDVPLLTQDGEVRLELPSSAPTALEQIERHELQRGVQECINALEEEFRAVVVLRDIQGYAYEEISEVLQLAIGTVKSRLFRARAMLRDCLKGKWGGL